MKNNSVAQGKVFVGGISTETTEENLTQHFCRYGEVAKSEIIKFRETGLSKGFGFVTFADSSVINQLLQDQQIILGRTVDVKLAIPRGQTRQHQLFLDCQQIQGHVIGTSRSNRRKIFVGGLPLDLSEEVYKRFFGRFGRIENAKIIFNRGTNTSRGFGFVTYDLEESVTNVLVQRFYWLNGKYVEVKRALPREWRVMNTSNYYYYEMCPIYNCHVIYGPHYWSSHDMVPSWPLSFNHLGINVPAPPLVPHPQPASISSTFAQNSESQFHNSVSHGGDGQGNNIEVQLATNGSPRGKFLSTPLDLLVEFKHCICTLESMHVK
ncbi:hypothetical protein FXO38_30857 [Capsicum annuum]|nr:hypothetical protein FXO38_30857 [Capsicum annuum]KAF3685771.1 hypothetical protein FXO37_00289 [Capsicum annuum]